MKVLIPVFGSRGDIQIYVNLAVKLVESGHFVTIATHPFWRQTIESLGLAFMPLGPNINVDAEAARFRKSYNVLSVLKLLNSLHLSSSAFVSKYLDDFDLLIVSHMLCGAMEAIKANKPFINVTFLPSMIPIHDTIFRQIPKSLLFALYFNLGPWGKIKRKLGVKHINNFNQLISSDLNLIPISRYILPQAKNWKANCIITGFWPLPTTGQELPEEILAFLEKHHNPIIVTFGAMAFDSGFEIEKVNVIIQAIQKSGNSGIIQGFDNTIGKLRLPESIIHIGSFPSSFFNYGKIIIHHCGFGTMTTGLFSGKPCIPIPHILDQTFWAARLYELGLCPKPIPIKKMTEQRLVYSIRICETSEKINSNSRRVMEMLKEEKGLENALFHIENFSRDHGI
jgi:UDP:flavonoid glycosyltransferase YjiC (YdhE family)